MDPGLAAFERKAREEEAKKEQSGGIRSYAEVCEQRRRVAELQEASSASTRNSSLWLERRRRSGGADGAAMGEIAEEGEASEVEEDVEELERQKEEVERERIFQAEMDRLQAEERERQDAEEEARRRAAAEERRQQMELEERQRAAAAMAAQKAARRRERQREQAAEQVHVLGRHGRPSTSVRVASNAPLSEVVAAASAAFLSRGNSPTATAAARHQGADGKQLLRATLLSPAAVATTAMGREIHEVRPLTGPRRPFSELAPGADAPPRVGLLADGKLAERQAAARRQVAQAKAEQAQRQAQHRAAVKAASAVSSACGVGGPSPVGTEGG